MNQGLIEAKMTDLKNYFKSHGDISTVYLFGSYGTLLYDPERSDIDLAIIFNRELTLKEEMLVDAEISVILESDNLDVVNLNKARVDICNHIISRKCLGMPKPKQIHLLSYVKTIFCLPICRRHTRLWLL